MDQLRVLVADDNRDTVLTLGILLRSEGNDVHLAECGEQVLAEARLLRPDVALLEPLRCRVSRAGRGHRAHERRRP